MYEDNILKRFPRYDNDFTLRDPSSLNWDEPGESSSSWFYSALVVLWILGVITVILCACAKSPRCLCYNLLYKLRPHPSRTPQYRQQPGTEYNEVWTNPHVMVGEVSSQAPMLPPSGEPQDLGEKDLPPPYSQVVKADYLPAYPAHSQSFPGIPDREWTTTRAQPERPDNII